MKSSLNHTYRSIWSEALNAWVAVSELTSAKGKRSGSSILNALLTANAGDHTNRNHKLHLKPLAIAVVYCFALNAQANPIGAQIVNGVATISQSANTLTVTNSPMPSSTGKASPSTAEKPPASSSSLPPAPY